MANDVVAKDAVDTLTTAHADKASPPLQRRKPLKYQEDAPQDLDVVSWPRGKRRPTFGKYPYYLYDVARGVDTYIYVISNGINPDNAVRIRPCPAHFFDF